MSLSIININNYYIIYCPRVKFTQAGTYMRINLFFPTNGLLEWLGWFNDTYKSIYAPEHLSLMHRPVIFFVFL